MFKANNSDPEFLLRRLNHGINNQLNRAAEGTGQKVLAHSKFKKMDVLVPEIGEQLKIGEIFEKTDSLITLHQRKRIIEKEGLYVKLYKKDGFV